MVLFSTPLLLQKLGLGPEGNHGGKREVTHFKRKPGVFLGEIPSFCILQHVGHKSEEDGRENHGSGFCARERPVEKRVSGEERGSKEPGEKTFRLDPTSPVRKKPCQQKLYRVNLHWGNSETFPLRALSRRSFYNLTE
jgi:hypothetical protein